MAERRTIWLSSKSARQRAQALIASAPEGFVVKISEPTRTDEQNKKLWPMIADIQRQVPDMAPYSANDAKLRFMDALGTELRFLPKLEGQGMFPVGASSRALTVDQFSLLLELLYKYGAENGVVWTDPETRRAA